MEVNEVNKGLRLGVLTGCFVLLTACGEEKVKKEEYDALKAEFTEYRTSVDAANQLGIKHQADLNRALADLSKVSGMTLSLRSNIENRTARVSQSDQIKLHIRAIESRMNDLEKQAGNNAALKKSIEQLRIIIKEKQMEIDDLHKQIEQQSRTIDTLQTSNDQKQHTIESQDKALEVSRNVIAQQHAQLLKSLYNAAHDIELLAVQPPKMRFSGNKKRMKEYQIKVAQLAHRYYQIAAEMGHVPSKEKAVTVGSYISKLQNE